MLSVAANHSFHNNAEYHPFQFHPVLGFIMAVVAVKDISKGSEVKKKCFVFFQFSFNEWINAQVFCHYNYSPEIFKAIGIFPRDLECTLVRKYSSGRKLEIIGLVLNFTCLSLKGSSFVLVSFTWSFLIIFWVSSFLNTLKSPWHDLI